MPAVHPTRGPLCSDSSMPVPAAGTSQEVALARQRRAAEDLRAGRLLRVFDLSLPIQSAYDPVSPETTLERPKIVAFCDGLLAEAQRAGGEQEHGSPAPPL